MDVGGKPRPIHVDRGVANIQWDRDTEWVEENLVDAVIVVHEDENCRVERTGLHQREFIDTFRVHTQTEALIHRNDSVHVMNLVDGREAKLVSTDGSFEPFTIHYAETCIIPQAAGEYKIVSEDGSPVMAIIATVRG